MNILGLVQLCDAAQPAGGYGETFGIDRLTHPDQLASVVENMLESAIAPADGVASGIAYRAARAGTLVTIPELCSVMSSPKVPEEKRRASVQMGQRLWGLSRGWQWAASMHEQLDGVLQSNELHHAVAFGTLVSETTSSQTRAIATYLLNVARNLVMAAVRAIPLDEMEGQRILARVQPRISELAVRCVDKQVENILVR